MSRGGPWRIERCRASAGEIHAASASLVTAPGAVRTVRVLEAVEPAVVLGKGQPWADVDAARAGARGVEVVRRCSGGGAVLVAPGQVVWIDVLVPAGDPLWDSDVGRAGWWLGEVWAEALSSIGVDGAIVHRGGLLRRPWSQRVCFAALGPGEISVEGRKVVGVSQRRTRAGALFQCAALVSWDPVSLLDVLALGGPERVAAARDLAEVAVGVGGSRATPLTAALLTHFG